MRGFDPPDGGTTSRCLNHLATPAVSGKNLPIGLLVLEMLIGLFRKPSANTVAAVLALAASGVALTFTNPSSEDFKSYAGGQLVSLISDELCDGGLPMVLQLWVKDCPRLILDQEPALAELAGQFSRRLNFGFASVYTTEIGGQDLLPTLRLPQYSVTTLGIAGQFVILHSSSDAGKIE